MYKPKERLLPLGALPFLSAFRRFAAACSTASPASRNVVGIRLVVRVPLRAMRLSRILRRQGVTTHEVLPLCGELQVGRIDAAPVTAQMVNRKPGWDRPEGEFVAHSMGRDRASVREREVPISSRWVHGSCPQPASIGFLDLLPEAVTQATGRKKAKGPIPPLAFQVHKADAAAMGGPITAVNRAKTFWAWHMSTTSIPQGTV